MARTAAPIAEGSRPLVLGKKAEPMLDQDSMSTSIVLATLAGDPARLRAALDDARIPYRLLATPTQIAQAADAPMVLLLNDPGSQSSPDLPPRAAATTAVVKDLTAEGEEALMRAGVNEVVALDDVTPSALARAINRARVRHAMAHDAEGSRRAAYGMLDRLPLALILTRPDGRIVHANAHAARLLADGRALTRTREGLLVAARGDDTARLREAIAAVAGETASNSGDGVNEGAIAVRSRDDDRTLSVILVPAGPAHPGAALFIADPDADYSISDDRLMSLYGLTRSEAQIVARLARGLTLEEIAATRGQQLNTIRTQVKSVFRKTNTRRQSDVIKLVLSGPAVITAMPAARPPAARPVAPEPAAE